jgi:hypothetical protein
MSGDPIGDDVRKLRRARRLGPDAACVVCGETNSEQLRRISRSLLEQHHLAGRANVSELTVVVCRNHHAQLSEAQRSSGVNLRGGAPRGPGARAAALLRGLADLAELAAPRWRAHADELEADESNRVTPPDKEAS